MAKVPKIGIIDALLQYLVILRKQCPKFCTVIIIIILIQRRSLDLVTDWRVIQVPAKRLNSVFIQRHIVWKSSTGESLTVHLFSDHWLIRLLLG